MGISELIKNIFGRKEQLSNPEFDIDKAVGEYLNNLPRCSRNVVLASPDYGDPSYNCIVITTAEAFLKWIEAEGKKMTTSEEAMAALKALPLWLRGADLNDEEPSLIPRGFFQAIHLDLPYFVNDGNAQVICLECKSVINDVKILDSANGNSISIDTEHTWKCPMGHVLYHSEGGIIINRRIRTGKPRRERMLKK